MSEIEDQDKNFIVDLAEVRRFIVDCFLSLKVPEKNAIIVADSMISADCAGHYSHGIMRMPIFVDSLSKKLMNGFAFPEIIRETASTALVDGRNGLGPVISRFCMDLAVKKAKQSGIAWVCARRTNNSGVMGTYNLRAMHAGFIGISMSNSIPIVAPTRSKMGILGANPLSVGMPGTRSDMFFLDMASSTVPKAKLDLYKALNKPIPLGWAIDSQGNFTTDANIVIQEGAVTSLGGFEESGGYKGYALSAAVDIFTGVLSGANYSKNVRGVESRGSSLIADVGQTFIAIDPNCFSPCFQEKLSDYNDRLRSSEPMDPSRPVLVPGDKRKDHLKLVKSDKGIAYNEKELEVLAKIAKKLNVQPMAMHLRSNV